MGKNGLERTLSARHPARIAAAGRRAIADPPPGAAIGLCKRDRSGFSDLAGIKRPESDGGAPPRGSAIARLALKTAQGRKRLPALHCKVVMPRAFPQQVLLKRRGPVPPFSRPPGKSPVGKLSAQRRRGTRPGALFAAPPRSRSWRTAPPARRDSSCRPSSACPAAQATRSVAAWRRCYGHWPPPRMCRPERNVRRFWWRAP